MIIQLPHTFEHLIMDKTQKKYSISQVFLKIIPITQETYHAFFVIHTLKNVHGQLAVFKS